MITAVSELPHSFIQPCRSCTGTICFIFVRSPLYCYALCFACHACILGWGYMSGWYSAVGMTCYSGIYRWQYRLWLSVICSSGDTAGCSTVSSVTHVSWRDVAEGRCTCSGRRCFLCMRSSQQRRTSRKGCKIKSLNISKRGMLRDFLSFRNPFFL